MKIGNAAPSNPRWLEEPFLHLRLRDGATQQTGQASTLLGTKLPAGASGIPEGLYGEWDWDGETLTVCNDRYGIYPLYWYQHGDDFGLSPSIPKLVELGAPRDWDEDALAVLMRFEACLGEDTPFKAIRALPPGATLTWHAGQVAVTSVPLPIPEPFGGTRDEAIEYFIELFRAAIRRRPPPEAGFGMPLSAGRDSRHILLELLEAGWRPSYCASAHFYPPRPDYDPALAAQLTALAGIEHVALEQPRSQLSVLTRHYRLTNYCTMIPSFFLWVVSDYLHGRTETVYDGLGGDVLSAGAFLTQERLALYEASRFSELADLDLDPESEGTLKSRLAPALYRRLSRERAQAHFVRHLERHSGAPDPVSRFFFHNRTRRSIALQPCRIFGRFQTVHCPYLDHALFDHLSSLPARMLVDHALHTDAIHRAFPRYAGVPFNGKSDPPKHDDAHYWRLLCEVAGGVLSHPRSRVFRKSTMLPRLALYAVDRERRRGIEWIGLRVAYLLGLEALTNAS